MKREYQNTVQKPQVVDLFRPIASNRDEKKVYLQAAMEEAAYARPGKKGGVKTIPFIMEEMEEFVRTKQQAKKGGLKTIPFIMANEIFEKVASQGLLANMIIYLKEEYHMTAATGTNVLFMWSALSNFIPIFGAFLSDSYLGRFRVIALGSLVSLAGMVLLWLSAMLPGARPANCDSSPRNCDAASSSQLALLFSSFALMSIGAGGIRPCSLAFGADQLEKKDDPKNERTLQTYFNFYYASVGFSIIIAVTVIVYIQDHKGFNVGFGIPVVLMILSAVFFLVGSPLYRKIAANKSMLSDLAQVIVAAVKNRKLALPPKTAEGWYHHKKGSNLTVPSDKLRFLNKASIIRNPENDLKVDGTARDPWSICTVQQVEDLKSVMRVLPIWSTGIVPAVIISQHSFPVLQADTMDRHLGPNFQIPAGSFAVFSILTLTLWVAVYDRIIVPQLAKITGRPRGLSLQQRMGIGLFLSVVATATSALIETKRRDKAIEQGLQNNPTAIVDMSAMWLVLQHCLTGLAEAFSIIGQIEFFYSEFPKSMASIGIALFACGMGIGNLVGSLIVSVLESVTGKNGGASWVSDNLNMGHYDYYYWLLTVLSVVNLGYFLVCSWVYGEEGQGKVHAENGGDEHEDGDYDDDDRTFADEILLKSPQLSVIM